MLCDVCCMYQVCNLHACKGNKIANSVRGVWKMVATSELWQVWRSEFGVQMYPSLGTSIFLGGDLPPSLGQVSAAFHHYLHIIWRPNRRISNLQDMIECGYNNFIKHPPFITIDSWHNWYVHHSQENGWELWHCYTHMKNQFPVSRVSFCFQGVVSVRSLGGIGVFFKAYRTLCVSKECISCLWLSCNGKVMMNPSFW